MLGKLTNFTIEFCDFALGAQPPALAMTQVIACARGGGFPSFGGHSLGPDFGFLGARKKLQKLAYTAGTTL